MGLHLSFPTDPHVILDPAVRWYPGEAVFTETGQATLLPPLVHKIRQGVKAWRDSGYEGASDTTRALLRHWFETEHFAFVRPQNLPERMMAMARPRPRKPAIV